MSVTKAQIISEAMALDPQEREELAEALWLSAQGMSLDQIERAGAAEARRRADAIDRGDAVTYEGHEVMGEARDIVRKMRRP